MSINKSDRILITGAGGSVGIEIAKQLHAEGYSNLVFLDRDGSHLHSLELALYGTGLLTQEEFVLADIRDYSAVEAIFSKHVPNVVIHAAALKHVPLLERFPAEAWKTNVIGTWNLLRAATQTNVGTFLHISTDKAVEPTTVLGKSKQIAEQLVAAYGQHRRYVLTSTDKTTETDALDKANQVPQKLTLIEDGETPLSEARMYLNVRFGNVMGSRGSVGETFKHQARNSLPLTVTSPYAKRYLMSLDQACQLILAGLTTAKNGQTIVLKMGEQVRVADYAQQIQAHLGIDVPIAFVGERQGDKTEEKLIAATELIEKETEKYWFLQARTQVPENLTVESLY